MSVSNFRKAVGITAAVLFLTAAGEVKDLSVLQAAVTYTRDNMERAQAAHESDTREVQRQQQIVADKKKELEEQTRQLDEAQKNAEQSQQQYLTAKEKYEKAQSALDAALNKK
ncbi:MAG TPA: hypothetical protein VFK88_00030 [Gallionella sp.]|nr:hypothetical protein [Gallionella sp.]